MIPAEAKPSPELRQALELILSRYPAARQEPFRQHPIRDIFRKFHETVTRLLFVGDRFTVRWSVGQGQWSSVPWLAILDPRETNSIQKGVYCIVLFRDDCSGIYLTLSQGVTALRKQIGPMPAQQQLMAKAGSIRKEFPELSQQGFQLDNHLDLRTSAPWGKWYQDATIAYKFYERGAIPADAQIVSDLEHLVKAYSHCVDRRPPEPQPGIYGDRTPEKFNRQQALGNLIDAIGNSGFIFEPWQIAAYVTALRTKPFVILAGISGTGKSKLPALVQSHTGGKFRLIPVRPDWTDSSDVLGYCDLQGTFKPGLVLSAADEARNEPHKHFACILDEMNLARVEQYFAEILSKIEDRRSSASGGFETDALLNANLQTVGDRWSQVNMPGNFALVGTVNMDETVHGFSRKVLDRAFTMELSDVELNAWGNNELISPAASVADQDWPVEAWFPRALNLPMVAENLSEGEENAVQRVIDTLIQLNQYLAHAQLQIAYRSRDEIALFVLHALETRESFVTRSGEEVDSLDIAIQMKILPRIVGGSSAVRRLMLQLMGWARSGKPLAEDNEAGQMLEQWDEEGRPGALKKAAFPRTAAKLCLMWERLVNEGYTSFWI